VEQVQEKVAVHSAEINHMKKDIDHIMAKVDKMDTSIDEIKSTLDEFKGGKRTAMWFFSTVAAIVAFLVGHWVDK
jgi:prefoldin subunit 5